MIPRSLRIFSKVVCGSVVFLIFMGALVTSNEAGLAVPDWPTSFGDNMFLFPPSKWRGIIFYEHVHRLVASVVGLLTVILAVWLLFKENRRWVKLLGIVAVVVVVAQGVLGGLTVIYKLPTAVSSLHGVLAQSFLIITIILAYSQSRELEERRLSPQPSGNRKILPYAIVFLTLVFVQLILGAVMRHSEAGLAVPDFPLMAGRVLPQVDEPMLHDLNTMRASLRLPAVSEFQVILHLFHRLGAILVFLSAIVLIMRSFKLTAAKYENAGNLNDYRVRTIAAFVGYVVLIQFALGILTLLTVRHPVITSLHVVTGAALLAASAFMCLRLFPLNEDQL